MAEAATTEQFQASWQVVKNVDSMEIPPFAVVQVWTADPAKKLIEVKRPTADSLQTVMIVANAPIPPDSEGLATFTAPVAVLTRASDGTPVTGDNWGTVADSFELGKGNAGFIALREITSGLGYFKYQTGSFGSNVEMIRFPLPLVLSSDGKCAKGIIQKWLGPTPTDHEDTTEVWVQLL